MTGGLCIGHAEAEADRLFSLWVRARDGRCTAKTLFESPCSGPLQCAHIIGRRNKAVRFDPDNAHALCAAHHAKVDQHESLGGKYEWIVAVLGEERWQALVERARIPAARFVVVEETLARSELRGFALDSSV